MKAIRPLLLLTVSVLLTLVQTSPVTAGSPERFAFNWQSTNTTPQPWNPTDWDVVVHSRDRETWAKPQPMQAQHGPDCSPPPATHLVTAYEDSVFLCKNHMMTAINAEGYGAIYFAPNRMVDFSAGAAAIRYHVSTLRMSQRDWHDIWITPFEDNLVLPLYRLPDLQGPPRNAVHIQLAGDDTAIGHVLRNFASADLPKNNGTPYDALLGPSATTRSDFELDISRTHIRFGMPQLQLWWIDTDVPDLGFSQGVVQLGHHSYNPTKATNGQPGTWHWSDFSISAAVPFTMLRGSEQSIHEGAAQNVCFPGAAPAQSWLRFTGVGQIDVSYDGGRKFVPAQLAAQIGPHNEGAPAVGLFASYWTPVPEGLSSVLFRGRDWYAGQWWVRDPAIWSRSNGATIKPSSPCPPSSSAAASPKTNAAAGASNGFTLAGFVQESELLAGARTAGMKNLMLLGTGFVIAIGIAGIAGFGLGRRRRHRIRPRHRPPS
jgi:hypothetical protein